MENQLTTFSTTSLLLKATSYSCVILWKKKKKQSSKHFEGISTIISIREEKCTFESWHILIGIIQLKPLVFMNKKGNAFSCKQTTISITCCNNHIIHLSSFSQIFSKTVVKFSFVFYFCSFPLRFLYRRCACVFDTY